MKTATEIKQDEQRIAKRIRGKKTDLKIAAVRLAEAENEKQQAQQINPEDSRAIVAEAAVDAAAAAVEQATQDLVGELEKEIAWQHRFYDLKFKKDEADIVFDIVKILDILKDLGFYRYDDRKNKGQTIYVQIRDGRIRQLYDRKIVRDAFVKYVLDLPDYTRQVPGFCDVQTTKAISIYRKLLGNINYYLGEDKLERLLPDEPITFMHDTYSTKYFYYRNCVVEVTASGIRTFAYDRLAENVERRERETGEKNGRYIWENSIMDRDYQEGSGMDGDFAMFCALICGVKDASKSKELSDQYTVRHRCLRSILGYLMHGNFECNLKAVLFMDVNESNSNTKTGGTGKGIIGKALGCMLNREEGDCKYISEAGKPFRCDDERRYSDGDLSTQLIHIEDIKKNFDFEHFYNDVTEFIPIRKMNVDRVMIKSKIMLSSNTPIDVITTQDAVRRRLVIFELGGYFSARHTPVDEFGRRFFESKWTDEDWLAFDQYMIGCAYTYMHYKDQRNDNGDIIGIMEPPTINYKRQLLKKELPDDFLYWFEDRIANDVKNMVYCELAKKDLYNAFREKYEAYTSSEKYARAFTKWCKFYLQVMGIPSAEKRSTQDIFILYPDLNDPKIEVIVK